MFPLRDSSSTWSSRTDDESFGWRIGTEPHYQITEDTSTVNPDEPTNSPHQQPQSVSSVDSGTSSGNFGPVQSPASPIQDNSSDSEEKEEDEETTEYIELQLLGANDEEDEKSFDYGRSAFCYTPERLVKCGEFRVLAPSPRFRPDFEGLETAEARLASDVGGEEMNGATQLARLLQSPQRYSSDTSSLLKPSSCKRCCPVRYGDGEVVLHTKHCPRDSENRTPADLQSQSCSEHDYTSCTKRQTEEDSPKAKDATGQKIADDSSGVSSVDGLTGTRGGDDWSCCGSEVLDDNADTHSILTSRRVSSELAYVSLEFDEQNAQGPSDASGLITVLEVERTTAHNFHSLLRLPSTDPEYLARLALAVEPKVRPTIRIISTDTEVQIERLRDKVDRLQGNSKMLYEELSLLKRDFAMDECRVNHLSEDIGKLQTEVHELRYLDDLLKLLRGELERVSDQIWPFSVRHAKRGTEEINLIV
ncbi:uncharacterized protein LOC106640598 [Copidosoma floridanum]|uniref:uncharacterized protein LOC106640598 n=1 Tax=Copidosoma floridanum TaxID=29053 RepID=UPI0006C94249|nr:uncharacterized protein LOC106640598 [Copidosoma floridanum]